MKRLSVFLMLVVQMFIFAQQVSVLETTEVTKLSGGEFYYPKFSADNSKIYFTKSDYQGLYSLDLSSNKLETISKDLGAGYEFKVSEDNKVYYRVNKFNESGVRREQSIVKKDLTTNEEEIVTSGKDLSVPQLINSTNLVFSKNGSIERKNYSKVNNSVSAIQVPVVDVENTKIVLWTNGAMKLLDPVKDGNYIWVSLSPDKTKLLFTSAGKGTYISDLNGNILVNIGYANAPKWSPDGKWISYMVDKDNGRQVISSDLFIASADGELKFQVTNTEELFEMYPEWASDMSALVYHSDDGRIFMTKLKFEE